MIKRILISIAALALGACDKAANQSLLAFCDSAAESAVALMVDAHGGCEAWGAQTSIYVEREHLFAGTENPIRFNNLPSLVQEESVKLLSFATLRRRKLRRGQRNDLAARVYGVLNGRNASGRRSVL